MITHLKVNSSPFLFACGEDAYTHMDWTSDFGHVTCVRCHNKCLPVEPSQPELREGDRVIFDGEAGVVYEITDVLRKRGWCKFIYDIDANIIIVALNKLTKVEPEEEPQNDFHALLSASAAVIDLWHRDKLEVKGNPSLHHLAAVLEEIAAKRKNEAATSAPQPLEEEETEEAWQHDPVNECLSCGEKAKQGECPKSKRSCGHHCNCSWVHDVCHWCFAEFGDGGELSKGEQLAELREEEPKIVDDGHALSALCLVDGCAIHGVEPSKDEPVSSDPQPVKTLREKLQQRVIAIKSDLTINESLDVFQEHFDSKRCDIEVLLITEADVASAESLTAGIRSILFDTNRPKPTDQGTDNTL